MNLTKELEKRFCKNGSHRKILNRLKQLKRKHHDYTSLREAIFVLKKRYIFSGEHLIYLFISRNYY